MNGSVHQIKYFQIKILLRHFNGLPEGPHFSQKNNYKPTLISDEHFCYHQIRYFQIKMGLRHFYVLPAGPHFCQKEKGTTQHKY